MEVIESVFRGFFALLDRVAVFLISASYDLFIEIADTNIFSDEIIEMFSQRIFALLAIFMLFKVAFSLLNYIINPDDFSDKGKGAGKLLVNVIIVLILLVSVKSIFEIAYDLQGKIVGNNVIPKIVLGVNGSDIKTDEGEISAGDEMAYIIYSALVTPNLNYPGMDVCEDMFLRDSLTTTCADVIAEAGDKAKENIATAIETHNAYNLLSWGVITAREGSEYMFNYTMVISTLAGGLVGWILLMFCIDIAIRVVKLGFLQLIAPIPIISYIDPKSSKDGMFKKWYKTALSTYTDLFIRLVAISFAIFLIRILSQGQITRLSNPNEVISFSTDPFVRILLLIGILLFAKQIPKLIEDLTGFKIAGDFTLNPLKRIEDIPYIGKKSSQFLGDKLNKGADLSKRVVGAGFGMAKDKIWNSKPLSGTKKAYDNFTENIATQKAKFGQTEFGMRMSGGDSFDKKVKTLETYADFKKQLKDLADFDITDVSTDPRMAGKSAPILFAAQKGTKGLKQYYEDLQNSGTATADEITKAREAYEEAQKWAIDGNGNAQINAVKEQASNYVKDNRAILNDPIYSDDKYANYDKINAGSIAAKNEVVNTKASSEYAKAKEIQAKRAEKSKK